ncbi:MAG: hypothetical protein WC341_13935 [Bacteroidales bacterium]|jgi:hypothetical protein
MRNFILIVISLCLVITGLGQGTPDSTFNTLIRTENGGWVAGDATYSIALPDGRTLWLFGDSFIGTVNADSSLAPGAQMIRNCAVLQDGDQMTARYQGTFQNPVDFVLSENSGTWLWPEHGLVENNTLKILYSEFGPNGDTSGWNFEFRETYLVLFTYPEIELIGQILLPYYDQNGVMYGDRLMPVGNYTYIYGRKEETGNIPYIHLARVETGNIQGNWEFYTGSDWSSDATNSQRLSDHAVSQQFGVFEHQGKWVMITQEIWLGSKIYSMVAEAPQGPWTNLTILYDTPRPYPTQFTYNAYPHPQFDTDNQLLVSYNSNGSFWDIFSNVELYRPSFIRVPYSIIDSSFTLTGINESPQAENHGLVINNCFPNPAIDILSFSFTLEQSQTLYLVFYSISGRKLKSEAVGHYTKGEHQINCSVSNLPQGMILYQIADKVGWFLHN